MSFIVTGIDEASQDLSRISDRMMAQALKAVQKEAESILRDSQDNYVPVDTRELRDSGRVTDVRLTPSGEIVTEISYSGPYAVAVHENPSSHDPPSWIGKNVKFSPSGHGPKFLEKPMMIHSVGMAQRVSKSIK